MCTLPLEHILTWTSRIRVLDSHMGLVAVILGQRKIGRLKCLFSFFFVMGTLVIVYVSVGHGSNSMFTNKGS